MPSFDIVSEVNQVEVRNALDQANREISTRFDFKGSDARVEHKEKELTLYADDDFKLKQVTDVLLGKLTKRSVDVRALKFGNVEKISGDKIKQVATLRVGIEQELAKAVETWSRQGRPGYGPLADLPTIRQKACLEISLSGDKVTWLVELNTFVGSGALLTVLENPRE